MGRVGNLKKSLFNTLIGSRARVKSEVHQSKMTKRVFAGLLDLLNLNTINRNPYITIEMKETINKLYADGLVSSADKRAIVALCRSIHEECLWYAFFSWMMANGIKTYGPTGTPFVDYMCSGAATVLDNWVTHPDVCYQAFINACYKFEVAEKLEPKPLYSGLLTHVTNQIMTLFSDTFQKNKYSGMNTNDFVNNNIYKTSIEQENSDDDDLISESDDEEDDDDGEGSSWSSRCSSSIIQRKIDDHIDEANVIIEPITTDPDTTTTTTTTTITSTNLGLTESLHQNENNNNDVDPLSTTKTDSLIINFNDQTVTDVHESVVKREVIEVQDSSQNTIQTNHQEDPELALALSSSLPSSIKIDESFSELVDFQNSINMDNESKKLESNTTPIEREHNITRDVSTQSNIEPITSSIGLEREQQHYDIDNSFQSNSLKDDVTENSHDPPDKHNDKIDNILESSTEAICMNLNETFTPTRESIIIEGQNSKEMSTDESNISENEDIGLLFSILGKDNNKINNHPDDEYAHLEVVYKTRPNGINVILADRALQSGRV